MQNSQKINSQNKINDINMNINDVVDKFIENNIEIIPINLVVNDKGKKINNLKLSWKNTTNKDYNFDKLKFNSYAIKTGKINNITVIDIDTKEDLEFARMIYC